MEKYGTARQTTDDNIIRRMRFACWITKATDTHSEYVILIFHGNNGYANAPQCYAIRTLPICSFSRRSSSGKLLIRIHQLLGCVSDCNNLSKI
jgi:hypothetical protein